MSLDDIARKRAILFSTRIRFSPETQPIRQEAIDKIIEQNLLIADVENGLTIQEIISQGAVSLPTGAPVIGQHSVKEAIKRLLDKSRVRLIKTKTFEKKRFRLSDQTLDELYALQQTAEKGLLQIVRRLFKDVDAPDEYVNPFLECLCLIFSQLGEIYVRLIKRTIDPEELLRLPTIQKALSIINKKYNSIDHKVFKSVLFAFFKENDPEYDTLKWNMAQNYYIARVLGLDPSGYLLSVEVFGDAVFYLDTNIIIAVLEPKADFHSSFQELSKACKKLNIDLSVCHISLEELKRVVDHHRDILPKVAEQIPEEIEHKVRGLFYELYRDKKTTGESVNIDELLSNFDSPKDKLKKLYNINLVDDKWFINEAETDDTIRLSNMIKERSIKTKRLYPKGTLSALHDALLLKWTTQERENSGKNVLLVTLDSLLPGVSLDSKKSPAITLDALLQWMSPMVFQDRTGEDGVATIYADAVRHMLLPQETFFDLHDFLLLADLEYSCKELPAEDVEKCVRHIKTHARNLNPNLAEDREKISREIARFFADPGRKYKKTISEFEDRLAKIDEQRQTETGELKQLIEDSKQKFTEFKLSMEKRDNIIEEQDQKISELQIELQNKDKALTDEEMKLHEELRGEANFRLCITGILFVLYEILVVYHAVTSGAGDNTFQKIINSWPLLALGIPLMIAVGYLFLGKQRVQSLGWWMKRLFRE